MQDSITQRAAPNANANANAHAASGVGSGEAPDERKVVDLLTDQVGCQHIVSAKVII